MNTLPLPERLRPRTLDEVVGQTDLLGSGKPLRRLLESGELPSMIFWGPPGVGKTTVARLVATGRGEEFCELSAVNSGVAEIRQIIELAENLQRTSQHLTLFLDEIHRFNKAQQDRLLPHVESGLITLIGATTENPSFEVIAPLLSRSRVFVFRELSAADFEQLISRAISDERGLSGQFEISDEAKRDLIQFSGGDARIILNTLELSTRLCKNQKITPEDVAAVYGDSTRRYDTAGEEHYNHASAFIKSMRGSDPDAALFYLGRMLAGGEDPKFIARRMIIFASEDVGNAMPNALVLATTTMTAVEKVGMPEARIMLGQTAIYLARAPKSRASYEAINAAIALADEKKDLPIPLHLRNPVTGLMETAGYGKGYRMPGQSGFEKQTYLPPEITGTRFYRPSGHGMEKE